MGARSRHAYLAPAIVTGWLWTLSLLVYRATTHRLGANPIATALNQLGLLSLLLLTASLTATPLKLTLGLTWPLRVRRTLGLLAFFSALLHFALYLGADRGFDVAAVLDDVRKRTFILTGFLALVLLVPLAWTSSKAAVSRLTFPVWQRLHRLVYAVALLAFVHFFQRVKADHTQPLVYAGVLSAGFGVRAVAALMKRRGRAARAARHATGG